MKKIQVKQLRTSGLPLHETLTTNQVELLKRLINRTQDASLLNASISVNKAYEDSVDYLETKSGLGINVTNYEYFRFADTSVESICAFNWGDNIGLSRTQAAAVTNTDLGTIFRNNTEITSFDELSYFSGLNTIPGNTSTNGAFQGCTALKSVTLPTSVNFIGQYAFEGDSSLTDVKNTGSVNTVNSYAFKDCTSLRNALFSNVSVIGNNSFINCTSLDASLTFNSLYNIGTGAFYNSAIKEIDAPLLTSIPSAADASSGTFGNCKGLVEFNAPNIGDMGAYAFYDDSSLKTIISSPTSLGGHCCENCESLESIELKDVTSMTSVNNFKNCKSLKDIGDGLSSVDGSLGEYNFAGCTSLEDVSLGAGITDIGEHCFEGDSSLQSVDFQGASCIIEPYAFADCSCLCNLYEVNGIKRIEYNSFKNNNIDLNLGELNRFNKLEYANFRGSNIKDVKVEDLNYLQYLKMSNKNEGEETYGFLSMFPNSATKLHKDINLLKYLSEDEHASCGFQFKDGVTDAGMTNVGGYTTFNYCRRVYMIDNNIVDDIKHTNYIAKSEMSFLDNAIQRIILLGHSAANDSVAENKGVEISAFKQSVIGYYALPQVFRGSNVFITSDVTMIGSNHSVRDPLEPYDYGGVLDTLTIIEPIVESYYSVQSSFNLRNWANLKKVIIRKNFKNLTYFDMGWYKYSPFYGCNIDDVIIEFDKAEMIPQYSNLLGFNLNGTLHIPKGTKQLYLDKGWNFATIIEGIYE